jgi:23S rRNA (adenine2030-N6)-methyltransferase
MLAYRHAFHAGNHADVLKHLVLMLVLRHLGSKDKGYRFVDTHGGAGGYSLLGRYATKNGEYERGIGLLWTRDDLPRRSPTTSRWCARSTPTASSRNTPARRRSRRCCSGRRTSCACSSCTRPSRRSCARRSPATRARRSTTATASSACARSCRRRRAAAAVLIDPSYEGNGDYGKVVTRLREAVERFAEGIYLVWYPQVTKLEAAQLPRRLAALAPKGWLHARLTVQEPDAQGFGLAGSGVFVLNPPHTLHATLAKTLPYLVDVLGRYAGRSFAIDRVEA